MYEYVTGGGTWSEASGGPPEGSLLREGEAMARALIEDFSQLDDVEVVALRDSRLPESKTAPCRTIPISNAAQERDAIRQFAPRADATVLIAPEIAGSLLQRVFWAESCDAWLLSPPSGFVELATDKHATAEILAKSGVPAARGVLWPPDDQEVGNVTFPAVAKPCDGAGSVGVRLVRGPDELADGAGLRVEPFYDGIAASVAVICGAAGDSALPVLKQTLSRDGRFEYLGGSGPLDEPLNARAQKLALAAVAALPPARGYVGIDLVLGEKECDDVVIEVNPRLTTSYVGLRRLANQNLAAAMLDAAAGQRLELLFSTNKVEFSADGRVSVSADGED